MIRMSKSVLMLAFVGLGIFVAFLYYIISDEKTDVNIDSVYNNLKNGNLNDPKIENEDTGEITIPIDGEPRDTSLSGISNRTSEIVTGINRLIKLLDANAMWGSLTDNKLYGLPIGRIQHWVKDNDFKASEIREAADVDGIGNEQRALMILCIAWSKEINDEDLDWCEKLTSSMNDNTIKGELEAFDTFSAIHALRLLSESNRLEKIAGNLLEGSEWMNVKRIASVLTLNSIDVPSNDEVCLEQVLKMTSSNDAVYEDLEKAAWAYLARCDDDKLTDDIINAVYQGDGAALAGIENIKSETALHDLRKMIEGKSESAFDGYRQDSVAKGLLSIGSELAIALSKSYLECDVELTDEKKKTLRRSMVKAFESCNNLSILGDLMLMESQIAHDSEAYLAIRKAIQNSTEGLNWRVINQGVLAQAIISLEKAIRDMPNKSSSKISAEFLLDNLRQKQH